MNIFSELNHPFLDPNLDPKMVKQKSWKKQWKCESWTQVKMKKEINKGILKENGFPIMSFSRAQALDTKSARAGGGRGVIIRMAEPWKDVFWRKKNKNYYFW